MFSLSINTYLYLLYRLTKEGIVDLSNLGSSSQSHIIEWKDEKGKAASTVSFEMNIDFKKAIYKVFNNVR